MSRVPGIDICDLGLNFLPGHRTDIAPCRHSWERRDACPPFPKKQPWAGSSFLVEGKVSRKALRGSVGTMSHSASPERDVQGWARATPM